MADWLGIQIGAWWPLVLPVLGLLLILIKRSRSTGTVFPDLRLVADTASVGGLLDRLPLLLGAAISLLLVLSLMDISIFRQSEVSKRARDFLVVVDTSRSMRLNTALLRKDFPPTYERRADLYSGKSDNPADIPELARYEVARQSLLQFLSTRRDEDRVGLMYFNSMVYPMSGFSSNFEFIEQQLAGMDPYVTYGTNIRWVLEQGLDLIERYPSDNRRALILLTDAEARNSENLQQQLHRLSKLNVAFYMLWITADEGDGKSSALATEFLRSARSIGSVYTIDDISDDFLDGVLEEISSLEDYAYAEVRNERVSLSPRFFGIAKWLTLLWLLLIGTLYQPLRKLDLGDGR